MPNMCVHGEEQKGNRMIQGQNDSCSEAMEDRISDELLKLSAVDRNALQEEIHGVRSLALDEYPTMISESLRLLSEELDRVTPTEEKRAYLLAKQFSIVSYVSHSVDFRLQFLRASLFDAKKAARNLIAYLHLIHSYFGEIALQRHLDLHKDFAKPEIRKFRKGRLQLLPYRDRSGRRIIAMFVDKEWEEMGRFFRQKAILYLTTIAATNDEETQRQGVVVLVWFDSCFEDEEMIPASIGINWFSASCVRISSIHFCHPDSKAFRNLRNLPCTRSSNYLVTRQKFHAGEVAELRHALKGYGIPSEMIPVTFTGTVKTTHHRNWMRLRKSFENASSMNFERFMDGGGSHELMDKTLPDIVDCPRTTDVLFRQGTSLNVHPGNARFRSMVEDKVSKFVLSERFLDPRLPLLSRTKQHDTIETLILEIINEITSKNGRALVWVPNHDGKQYGCWSTLTDEDQIYSKIEYIVRELLRGMTFVTPPNTSSTATESESVATKSPLHLASSNDVTASILLETDQPGAVDRSKSISRSPKHESQDRFECYDLNIQPLTIDSDAYDDAQYSLYQSDLDNPPTKRPRSGSSSVPSSDKDHFSSSEEDD